MSQRFRQILHSFRRKQTDSRMGGTVKTGNDKTGKQWSRIGLENRVKDRVKDMAIELRLDLGFV